MKEVSSRAIFALVKRARSRGLPVGEIMHGLSFGEAELGDPFRRLDWNDVAELVERLEAVCGGREKLHIVGTNLLQANPSLIALAQSGVSPCLFYRLMLGPFSAAAFPHMICRYERRGELTSRLVIHLPAPYRDCPAFFFLNVSIISSLATLLALPPAQVSADIRPRHAEYFIKLAAPLNLAGRERRASIAFLNEQTLSLFEEPHVAFIESFKAMQANEARGKVEFEDMLQRANQEWRVTHRELEVASLLVRGLSNKEIGQQLSCAVSTVELHVTQVLRKSGSGSRSLLIARFWSKGSGSRHADIASTA